MIKWFCLFIALQSITLCQKYNIAELVIGKRGTDSYRVWIYFSDKDGSASITLSEKTIDRSCLLYTSPSPRDAHESRMPSSA